MVRREPPAALGRRLFVDGQRALLHEPDVARLPAVFEAAVIACRHPKWDERPLLVVVKKPGASVTREELLAFYEGKVAKWWIPDDVVFVAELPHTATGKLLKTALRERYRDHPLPMAAGARTAMQS